MAGFVSDDKGSYAGLYRGADNNMFCDNVIVRYPVESVLWGCNKYRGLC